MFATTTTSTPACSRIRQKRTRRRCFGSAVVFARRSLEFRRQGRTWSPSLEGHQSSPDSDPEMNSDPCPKPTVGKCSPKVPSAGQIGPDSMNAGPAWALRPLPRQTHFHNHELNAEERRSQGLRRALPQMVIINFFPGAKAPTSSEVTEPPKRFADSVRGVAADFRGGEHRRPCSRHGPGPSASSMRSTSLGAN